MLQEKEILFDDPDEPTNFNPTPISSLNSFTTPTANKTNENKTTASSEEKIVDKTFLTASLNQQTEQDLLLAKRLQEEEEVSEN